MEKKLSAEQALAWISEFYASGHRNLRLGQAFVNQFLPGSGSETADIYYETNNKISERIIFERYVEGGK